MKLLSILIFAILISCSGINQAQQSYFKQADFRPAKIWSDTNGDPINAHGVGILYHKGISADGINFCFGCKLTFRTYLIRLITGIILMKLPELLVGINGLKTPENQHSVKKEAKKNRSDIQTKKSGKAKPLVVKTSLCLVVSGWVGICYEWAGSAKLANLADGLEWNQAYLRVVSRLME